MTKTEFIRRNLNEANLKGAFPLEVSRSLANCIDQLEQDIEKLTDQSAKTNEELKATQEEAEKLKTRLKELEFIKAIPEEPKRNLKTADLKNKTPTPKPTASA